VSCAGGEDRLAGGGQAGNQRMCWPGSVSSPRRIGSIFQASVRVSFVDLFGGCAGSRRYRREAPSHALSGTPWADCLTVRFNVWVGCAGGIDGQRGGWPRMPAVAAGMAGSALTDLGVGMPGRVIIFPVRPGPLLPGGRPVNGFRGGVIGHG